MDSPQRETRPRLVHSISMANMEKREIIKKKLTEVIDQTEDGTIHFIRFDMSGRLNYMPSFLKLHDDFAKMVMEDMVESAMMDHLSQVKAINCFRNVATLYPLTTTGDGNCLLHAASLAMWSFSDHNALLRRLVYVALCSDKGLIKARWQRRQERVDKDEGIYSHTKQEWNNMWEAVKESASDITRKQPNQLPYKSLEHIHVFVLSNILRRPIVIVSDTVVHYPSGSVHESVDTFDGIYLPLLWKPEQCYKYPLVIGYANSHFAPLLGMDQKLDDRTAISRDPDSKLKKASNHFREVIPLVNYKLQQRIVPFLLENEEKKSADLLRQYLVLTEIPQTESSAMNLILCAELKYNPLEDDLNLMWDHFEELTKKFRKSEPSHPPHSTKPLHLKQATTQDESLNLNLTEKPKTVETAKKNIEEFSNKPSRYPEDWSLLPEECIVENCKYRASKNTAPYCHQHPHPEYVYGRRLSDLNLMETNEDEPMCESPEVKVTNTKPCPCEGNCKKEACFNGQCHHHYATEPLRQEYPMCKTQGCHFHGTPRNALYCSECVKYYGLSTDDLEILKKLPARQGSESANARAFFKCEKEGCYAASTETTLGYCNKHFLELYKAEQIKIPTAQEAEIYLKKMKSKLQQRSSLKLSPPKEKERKRTPSGQVREKKHLCATPGCAGVRCKDTDLCLECFRNEKYNRDPAPIVLPNFHVPHDEERMEIGVEPEVRRGNPDIIESRESSAPGSPGKTCVGPGCQNRGLDLYKGLCEQCYKVLQESKTHNVPPVTQLKPKRDRRVDLFGEPVRQCRTSGCGYAGTVQQNGYCSKCYDKQQTGAILSEETQRSIKENFQTLIDHMQVRDVIDHLFSKLVLNSIQMDELQVIPTEREKIRYLLMHLLHAGSEQHYGIFLQVLRDTRQRHLADILAPPRTGARNPTDDDVTHQRASYHSNAVAEPCVSQSCDRYGDPYLSGFCSKCAKRRGVLASNSNVPIVEPAPGHRNIDRESQGPSDSGPTSQLCISGSDFEESYAQVERTARESRKLCKYRGCQNFGNPLNNGYCNSGHIECDTKR